MSPIISEIYKITVDAGFKLDSPAFAKLRQAVVKGGVKEQYYGISTDEPTVLFWVVQWPGDLNPAEYKGSEQAEDFSETLEALDVNSKPVSWYLPFDDASLPRPALTAPLCQLCVLHVNATTPRDTIIDSLVKTFTDCYHAGGFTGGNWSTATNDGRMNYYYLGWETREHHAAYSKSELCALELGKLMPHMDDGWAHFMKMTQQLS